MGASKFVSRKQTFNMITEEKKKALMMKQIKKRSLYKIQWGVQAYSEWRKSKFENFLILLSIIYEADIEHCDSLTKANVCHALCCFLPEITKLKDCSPYPSATLYQMIIAIQ